MQWQTMAELERDLKRNEMEVIRLEVLELRRKALAVFEARDAVAAHNQTVVFLAQEALCWDHILRAKKAIYDREQADAQWWEDVQDSIQTRLDYAGFIPILGAGPDLLNALISAKRGNAGGFTLSVAAALPIWGDSVKATAMAAKRADEAVAVVNAIAKNGEKAKDVLKAGDEAGEVFAKNLDQLAKEDALKAIEIDDIIFNKYLDDLVDSHHGTPRQVIDQAQSRYRVDPKEIMGKAGQKNLVDVAREMHKLGHAGKLNGLPKYNEAFFRRLEEIKKQVGKVTAADIWRVRDEMLRLYFGIGV